MYCKLIYIWAIASILLVKCACSNGDSLDKRASYAKTQIQSTDKISDNIKPLYNKFSSLLENQSYSVAIAKKPELIEVLNKCYSIYTTFILHLCYSIYTSILGYSGLCSSVLRSYSR